MEEVTGELVGQGWQDPREYMEKAGGLESRACLGWAKLDMEPKALRLGTWGGDRAVLLPASRGSVHGQGWTPALPLSLGPPPTATPGGCGCPPRSLPEHPGHLSRARRRAHPQAWGSARLSLQPATFGTGSKGGRSPQGALSRASRPALGCGEVTRAASGQGAEAEVGTAEEAVVEPRHGQDVGGHEQELQGGSKRRSYPAWGLPGHAG